MIELDVAYLAPDAKKHEVLGWQRPVDEAVERLTRRLGPGQGFLGWVDVSKLASDELLAKVQKQADDLREKSDALVVVGIGGSYLGARAVIEALAQPGSKDVHYAGINLSADYHAKLLEKLAGTRVAVNVISKSGTTTEPAVAFRLFKNLVQEQSGNDASGMIVATTDPESGALLKMAEDSGYDTYVVPKNVGGRFSVLSAVGLLPIAYAGIDISELAAGAKQMQAMCQNSPLEHNPCYYYAAVRNALYGKGFCIEMLAAFEPRLRYFAEWWKQLFGESEGKEHKGLFPASLDLTADLHSMGQYAQQGRRMLIETFLIVGQDGPDLRVPSMPSNEDGMEYLAGKPLQDINNAAYRATALAHREGGVPNMTFHLKRLDARTLGGLIYLFERACAVSGYLLRVNPFDQPGVDAYKNHMFGILDKPGSDREAARMARANEKREMIKFEGD